MESFATAWDIELDTSKTQVWSTCSKERARFRSCGLKVVHNMRELGGHLQLTCAMTNATLVDRGRELADLWPKLQSSPSPKSQKLKAVMVSAWPRGLQGLLGSRHFEQLRAAAMRATGNVRPGASAKLHFSMVEFPLLDPAFAALKMTAWDLRVHTTREEISPLPYHLCACGPRRPPDQGCIREVGWAWVPGQHLVQDAISAFSLWDVFFQELLHHLVYAWQQLVSSQLSAREGFQGLQNSDPFLTRLVMADCNQMQQWALRVVQNGTHFTQGQGRDSRQCLLELKPPFWSRSPRVEELSLHYVTSRNNLQEACGHENVMEGMAT